MSDYEKYVEPAAKVFYEARTKNNWVVCAELYHGLADQYRDYARAVLEVVGPQIVADSDELPYERVLGEDEWRDE